jgi:hypothetical protein
MRNVSRQPGDPERSPGFRRIGIVADLREGSINWGAQLMNGVRGRSENKENMTCRARSCEIGWSGWDF